MCRKKLTRPGAFEKIIHSLTAFLNFLQQFADETFATEASSVHGVREASRLSNLPHTIAQESMVTEQGN